MDLKGVVLDSVASLAGVAITALAGFAIQWVREKSKTNKLARVTLDLWEVAYSVVAHLSAAMPASLRKATADGSLSASDRASLKTEALQLARSALAERGIHNIQDIVLSGYIERALANFRAPDISNAPAIPATATSV